MSSGVSAEIKITVNTDGVPSGGEEGMMLGFEDGKPKWIPAPKGGGTLTVDEEGNATIG